MIRISVAGAAGRMGSRICALAIEHPEINLSGAFEVEGHSAVGKDIGDIIGLGKTGITISDKSEEALPLSDILIDFSTVSSSLQNARACAKHRNSIVIGTTGFTSEQMQEIKSLSSSIAIVFAPNMSVGVNLLLRVLSDIARTLGDDYDVEIIEAHHRLKKDAPSGTARKMADVISRALDRNLNDVAVYCRNGMIGERKKKEIGIQTVRAGDIVGEHTVMFAGLGERIEITHKASSRDTFARGALKAALWLKTKQSGLYDMQDVLGIK
ncbi:dihydrodipicolinate reductase [Candidatus Magnetoovum chiemensis]|nr:dihydrodipicolinate reductase [Candidatus Magnetoovum chiemensis]